MKRIAALCLFVVPALACGGGGGPPIDARGDLPTAEDVGPETTPGDAATGDAGEDAATGDGGEDTNRDAGSTDAVADAGTDSATDAGATDAPADLGGGDTPVVCPAGDAGDAAAQEIVLPPSSAPAVTVDVTLDKTLAFQKGIGINGGTITVDGADGATYQLVVPADAVFGTNIVTLTPVASIRGIPTVSGAPRFWGVQIEPEGVTFYKPAKLIIKPPSGQLPPPAEQVVLQWKADGTRLALAPVDPASSEVSIPVLRFGGVGVMQTENADAKLSDIRLRLGGAPEEIVDDMVGAYLQRERLRRLTGSGGCELAGLSAALSGGLVKKLVDDILAPKLAAAAGGCAPGWLAIELAHQYAQLLGLCGVQGGWQERAVELLSTVSVACMTDQFQTCRDRHIVQRIMSARLDEHRRRFLISGASTDPDLAKLDAFVKGCLKFEIDVDSRARDTPDPESGTGYIEEAMQARNIALTLQGSTLQWIARNVVISGSGPYTSVDYVFVSGESCLKQAFPSILQPATFEVKNLSFNLTPPPPDDVMDLTVVYMPAGGADVIALVDVCHNNTGTISRSHSAIDATIMDKTNPYSFSFLGYILTGWTVSASTEIGRRVVQANAIQVNGIGTKNILTKDELFVIRHVPAL